MDTHVTDIILESISDGVFTVNHEWKIMFFNKAAEEITGFSRNEAIGRYCWEVFRSNMCKDNCALKKTMKEERSFVSSSTFIITSQDKRIPIGVFTSLLKNETGEILGGVETFRDNSVVEDLRREIRGQYHKGDIITGCREMKSLLSMLPQIAKSSATVLIEGETGTGKEIIAKAIHALSLRKEKPFIAINCGALPDSLLESELFGYSEGAFTDACKDKEGYFAAAKDGTIFLDEIGETSQAFQVKLLRVLQEKVFQPLGSTKSQECRVRIITATNKNLENLMDHGHFRRDLYYRINVVCLQLPPLRERKRDIPLLTDHFIKRMNALQGKNINGLEEQTLSLLMHHDYPGNIRELENIIEHCFVLCTQGLISPRHLPRHLVNTSSSYTLTPKSMEESLQKSEKEIIYNTLEKNNFNRSSTAKQLGIHKSTLFRKIKKLNIELPKKDGRFVSLQTDSMN